MALRLRLPVVSVCSRLQQCPTTICFVTTRSFGFGSNWPETSKRKSGKKTAAPTKRKTNKANLSFPSAHRNTKDSSHIPPACLLPTASPYAYIARSAAVRQDMDPKSIYAHASSDPLQQMNGQRHFVYQETTPVAASDATFLNEVAFLGRSNVGKSSLINAIMQKKLARTSKRPGRTQQAHYFALQDCMTSKTTTQNQQPRNHGYLVDLPGYGFAVGPDDAVDAWQAGTQDLLLSRRDSEHLRRVYLLVDARHGCLEFDFNIMRWLDDACIPYSIVLTKADAVTLPVRVKWVNQVCMRYEHLVGSSAGQGDGDDEDGCWMHPIVHLTSSNDGLGLVELKMTIQEEFVTADWDDTSLEV